jgi:ABC-2 type transport system permease protein
MPHSLQRLAALTYKETVQILRDRRTLLLFFVLPVIQMFLFVYAVNLTVEHLPTALVDHSLDTSGRDYVQALVNSGFFDITQVLQNEQEVIRAIDLGQVKAGVVIPSDFAEQVARGQGSVLILLDGSDSFSVQSGYHAASSIAEKHSIDLIAQKMQRAGAGTAGSPLVTATRVLYNPDINDLIFILPGLIALIMQNVMVAHSAVAVVRERELGTLEQLLATPARPMEMVLAKLIPGMVVAMLDMAFILTVGVVWFKLPFQGSVGLLAVLSILFTISGMGLGLLISAISKTQRQAQMFSTLLNLLTMLLTGFIYTRTTMPLWTQLAGNLIPLTYYLRIIRGIVTKGIGIEFLWPDTLALVIYSCIALLLAAAVSKKRLD